MEENLRRGGGPLRQPASGEADGAAEPPVVGAPQVAIVMHRGRRVLVNHSWPPAAYQPPEVSLALPPKPERQHHEQEYEQSQDQGQGAAGGAATAAACPALKVWIPGPAIPSPVRVR